MVSPIERLRRIPRAVRITVLAVLLGAAIVAFVTTPRIIASVGPTAATPALNPFLITNRGYFAAHELKLQCIVHEAEFVGAGVAAAAESKPPVTTVTSAELKPGDSLAVTCERGFAGQAGDLKWADVDVNVCLKPYPVIDYISLYHYRFVGRPSGTGFEWSQDKISSSSIGWMMVRHESDVQECVWAEM